ncbi:helix-turn-helix transcriptional regulator [Microbacterium sp. P05]|uniref:helix-turn-helix transcriptional regulator n=1 Tax=Microbacterium sp. P05 TaxID=3366948 RepID=UPI00374680F9
MSASEDMRQFLSTRRARLNPANASLPYFGGRRRVPGLRREEVAQLAGMSTEYYIRLERGAAVGFSEGVLRGVARALELDEVERAHFLDLVRAVADDRDHRSYPHAPVRHHVSARLQQTIDAMSTVPILIQNNRLDAVAANDLGRALFCGMLTGDRSAGNAARFLFLEPSARTFYRDWENESRQIVAILRRETVRDPDDRRLTDLIGQLSIQDDTFQDLWTAHDVGEHRPGVKFFHHPVAGEIDLTYEIFDPAGEPGLQMLIFSATPDTPSHDGLRTLSS